MSKFSVPGLQFLDGKKTLIASWIQLTSGLLLAVVQFLNGINDCLNGVAPLNVCFDTLPTLVFGVIVAANGLLGLGLGHRLENVEAAKQ